MYSPRTSPTFVYVWKNYTPAQLAAWKKRFDAWLKQGHRRFRLLQTEDEGKAPASPANSSANKLAALISLVHVVADLQIGVLSRRRAV